MTKLPRCKEQLDRLIDWYEAHKPGAGAEIRVAAVRRTVLRFAKPKQRGGPPVYRGRLIVTKDVWAPQDFGREAERG